MVTKEVPFRQGGIIKPNNSGKCIESGGPEMFSFNDGEYKIATYSRVIKFNESMMEIPICELGFWKRLWCRFFKPEGYHEKYKRIYSKRKFRINQSAFIKSYQKRRDEAFDNLLY